MYYSNVLLGINTFINPLYIYAQFRLYLQKIKDKIHVCIILSKKNKKIITYKSLGLKTIPHKIKFWHRSHCTIYTTDYFTENKFNTSRGISTCEILIFYRSVKLTDLYSMQIPVRIGDSKKQHLVSRTHVEQISINFYLN